MLCSCWASSRPQALYGARPVPAPDWCVSFQTHNPPPTNQPTNQVADIKTAAAEVMNTELPSHQRMRRAVILGKR